MTSIEPLTKLGRRLESMTRKALYDYKMLEGVTRLGIALSGGKDSLSMLHLLKVIMGRGFPDLDIIAFHVSGEFSCGAGVHEGFLRSFCDALGVKLVVRESTQKLETLECYSCSRERRRLLFGAMHEHGVDTIAFGHHRDDNAQTALMNLFHKASFEGLQPTITMHAYGVRIIRPLIYVSEDDIRTFAQQRGYARTMCRCPVGQNSLRHQTETLLADTEGMYPNIRANVSMAALRHGTKKALLKPPKKTVTSGNIDTELIQDRDND